MPRKTRIQARRLSERQQLWAETRSQLALMSDKQLCSLCDAKTLRKGWGLSHETQVGKTKVFIKRLLLTDKECVHAFSTKNIFKLPMYYNYGVGSAGFGAHRELAMHEKITQWVLNGDIANFPIMYYSRIVKRSPKAEVPNCGDDNYIKYWNKSKAVAAYMDARKQAPAEIIVVLEHFPVSSFRPWMNAHMDQMSGVIGELRDTITFLRQRGITHFDAHFGNVVSDGRRPYLVDFGLALDQSFDLSAKERQFAQAHSHYDYAQMLNNFTESLCNCLWSTKPRKKAAFIEKHNIKIKVPYPQLAESLFDHLEEMRAEGMVKHSPNFDATLLKYRKVMMHIAWFFEELVSNNRKNTEFDNAKLKRLITQSGLLKEANPFVAEG